MTPPPTDVDLRPSPVAGDGTRTHDSLTRENVRLAAVVALQRDVAAAAGDRAAVEALVVERVMALTGAEGAVLCGMDAEGMVYRACAGIAAPYVGTRMPFVGSLSGLVATTGQSIRTDDFKMDPRMSDDLRARAPYHSGMATPLAVDGCVRGVLMVFARRPGAFDDEALRPLELAAGMVAAGVERAAHLAALRDSEQRFRWAFGHSAAGMCLVGTNGCFLEVNHAFQSLVGRTEAQLLGQATTSVVHPGDVARVTVARAKLVEHGGVEEFECRLVRPDTEAVLVHVTVASVRSDGDEVRYLISHVQDITARRASEELVRASLREKEVLLKEVHHRVKNNLQVVTSILRLKAQHVADPVAQAVLSECQDRVRAIALLHEKLYGARDLTAVDMGEYVGSLVQGIVRAQGSAVADVFLDAGSVHLDADAAIPCGLVVNELVTNAFKHGYPGDRAERRRGRIDVRLGSADGRVELTVRDDGVGLALDADTAGAGLPAPASAIGMYLVRTLTRQLGGTVSLRRAGATGGTLCTVSFPEHRGDEDEW